MATVVPVSERFTPYLLEMQMTDQEEDGTSMAVVLVLVVKPSGILLAGPVDFFPEDMLSAGHLAGPDDMIGPSVHVVCPAGRLQQMDGSPPVVDVEDKTLEVLLVDALPEIADNMSLVADYSGPVDALHLFDQDPFNYPMKDEVLALAWDWIVQPTSGDRVNYYSAQEDEEEKELVPDAPEEGVLPVGNGIQPGKGHAGKGIGLGKPKSAPAPKVKRPTVSQLATSLEGLTAAIPALTDQIAELSRRTIAMEDQMKNPSRLSALSQPLGSSATPGFVATSGISPAELLKEMPPPTRTLALKSVTMNPIASQQEAETSELVMERDASKDSNDMVRAMFAQSTAITALAAQIANMSGDAMSDLSSGTTGMTSKGASGRMKLQQDLSSHKGLFFDAVMMNMCRRMNPASSSSLTPMQMSAQGATMTRYVERFGGFGKVRDYGQIMWQVAMIMDYLQQENWQGAKDAAALLTVCLEQSALDGSMDVGLLLSLAEDPPSGVFTNRSLAPLSRGKAFAPLADQRWITVALSFIRELDVISQRRSDVVGGSKSSAPDANANPKTKAKGQPKSTWKKKKKNQEEQEDQ